MLPKNLDTEQVVKRAGGSQMIYAREVARPVLEELVSYEISGDKLYILIPVKKTLTKISDYDLFDVCRAVYGHCI